MQASSQGHPVVPSPPPGGVPGPQPGDGEQPLGGDEGPHDSLAPGGGMHIMQYEDDLYIPSSEE